MNILALIPARGGSKGIPRKNIAPLAGRPLIAWTIADALAAGSLGRTLVSTDDGEIAAVARAHGGEAPFLRPPELAGDQAAALPVIQHAVAWADAEGWRADAVLYLQPTSPFRGAAPIMRAVDLLEQDLCDTVVSVVPVPHAMTPDALMQKAGNELSFVAPPERRVFRRQDKPMLYARNGPAILGLTREAIMRGELYGARIKAVEMSPLASIDIDTPLDLAMAEALAPLVLKERAAGRL
ncbi:MAG TPA: acylneuraminate cytidylyltransferase family protein [Xanthobacteraceae bacterium]|nr:acylneuraminate cytidylyltransferase family protein [Xanthobacteraceae bacterium]